MRRQPNEIDSHLRECAVWQYKQYNKIHDIKRRADKEQEQELLVELWDF